MQRILMIATALLILAAVNFSIYQKEQLLANGTILLLKLAPVDPRSLMQGDYMQLRYEIAQEVTSRMKNLQSDGVLIVQRDSQQVGHFVKIALDEEILPKDHYKLRFRKRANGIRLGAESFFFQERQGEKYQHAQYGELRVAPSGESVLVGLRDAQFKVLSAD